MVVCDNSWDLACKVNICGMLIIYSIIIIIIVDLEHYKIVYT